MPSVGPNTCTVGTNQAYTGAQAWANPGNITASDNVYCVCTFGNSVPIASQELRARGFGFSIPTGATINSVTADIERKSNNGTGLTDTLIQLFNGTANSAADLIGSNQSAGAAWSTTEAYVSFVFSGTGLTDTIINSANFGVAMRASASIGARIGSVDHVRMTVDYTAAGATYTVTNFCFV